MSKQVYGWKRFLCPRSGSINLADGGYLYDPDAEWGKTYNPDLKTLEVIASVPCLVLLGEPGIGKSQELENLRALIGKKICDPRQVLELNLRSCTNLKDDLFKDEAFIDWLRDTYHLYLFLDSLDEGILSIPNLAVGLIDELKKKKYRSHINRLHLYLACRTFVFPTVLEEGLKELWQEDQVEIYELAPLRRVDVIEAAKVERLLYDDFLKEIRLKDVVPLAIKPITLGFLLNTYHRYNSQFPPNQKLHELYLEGCKHLCEEVNQSRRGSNRIGNLDSDQRLIIAARIAAITIFANRFAVWTEIDRGNVPTEDVLLQALCLGYENANGREFEITREAIEEVLDTGLFSSRGLHRMGWAHQTYAEFLAAWYLTQHEIPLAQLTELIFSSEDPDYRLIPQLHETAAWLATMRSDVLQEIIKTDPDVLLRSDVPTDVDVGSSIVDNLLTQYEEEKLFDRGGNNYRNYAKLRHPRLVDQLRPYICDSSKQVDARDLAIDIAEVCKISELQEELVNLALDSSQSIYLRVSAANALCSIGDEDTRLKLKPLAIDQLPEDENDQLKGYALQAVWSDHLTAEELFQALTSPKKRNFFGGYQMFLDYEIFPQLQPNDLVVALNWLETQKIRSFGHPFERLRDTILLKAWESFDLPRVAESFITVALIQWREHQAIITHDSKLQEQFASSLLNDSKKRHTLIEQAVLIVSETEEDLFFLSSSLTENVLISEDIFWMLEKLQNNDSEKAQYIWAQLIEWSFNRQDAKQIDAINVATQSNRILQKVFVPYFALIELNSAQANNLRADYLRRQEMQVRRQNPPLLDSRPKERVLQLLEKLEAGDLSAWWQLNIEMTLKPESKYRSSEFELDLTKLPGWQEAEEATRKRIIVGAKNYIWQQDNIDYEWIGTNTFGRPALAGCRAFQLLLQENPDFIDKLSSEIWKKWAPVIVAASSSNQHENSYLELVKSVYLNAPEESTTTLLKLIDKENQEYNYLYVIEHFDKCWSERLNLALLEKAKDPTLKPKCVGQILEKLIKQGFTEARDFAKSLISFPLPSVENEREKTLIAARVLVENSDPSSWSFIWLLTQQDLSFGREVFELAVHRHPHGIQLNLTEIQLADLYIWLVRHYPHNEDPDHSNDLLAHDVTARDGMAGLRDNVLIQLKERGTLQACAEIQRLIQELPDIHWLGKTLINAQTNMRRKTWQPPTPKEIFQIVAVQRIEKMKTEQSNHNFSGATFNAPVNFASNYGNQAQNLNIQNTDLKFEVFLADFRQFVTDLQCQYPNINTLEAATQTITSQVKQLPQPRLQNFLNLKRLWNGSKKAGLKVGEHFAESNVCGKGAIAFLEGVSEAV